MAGSPNLVPGSIFAGDFRVVKPLSAGGMGMVYVAHQLSTGRDRALKIMLGELADNRDLKRRFEQEARIGAQIDSEHVVEVVGAGVDAESGTPWLAMELLQGMDLATHLREVERMSVVEARQLFDELAHALSAAHDKQIVHRDLKPENLFLARSRRANAGFTLKVLDFGIAKLMNQARTSATGTMGTPLWMAPEQAQAGAAITPAADVWALGLIAFRVLSGKCFWKAASSDDLSAMMILREILMEPIVLASVRTKELAGAPLPPGFDAWFSRCVDRDASRRFPNANVAHQALRQVLDAPTEAPAPTPVAAAHRTVAAAPIAAAVAAPRFAPPADPVAPTSAPALPPAPISIPEPMFLAKAPRSKAPWIIGGVLGAIAVVAMLVIFTSTDSPETVCKKFANDLGGRWDKKRELAACFSELTYQQRQSPKRYECIAACASAGPDSRRCVWRCRETSDGGKHVGAYVLNPKYVAGGYPWSEDPTTE